MAISARGNALLKLIAAAGDRGLMLTQAEAHMALKDGDITVDTSVTEGEGNKQTARVTLTDAGRAKIAPKSNPVFAIDDAVPLPEKKKGGAKRGSKYPFGALAVGQSFHVPATVENPEPLTALASSLTGARRLFSKVVMVDGAPVTEQVEVNTYATDAKGKRIKDADTGKWVVTGKAHVTRNVTEQERDFVAAAVGADDPRGPGARVYRTK